MTRWIGWGGLVVGALATGLAVAIGIGGAAWSRATARGVERLRADAARGDVPRVGYFSVEELAGLPAPVARYFTFALTPGQRLVRSATLRQEGEFAVRPEHWAPFTAVEHFTVWPPGFLWDAKIRMAPLLSVRVRDSYEQGEGVMQGALAGVVPVVDQRGTPEMAAGSLLRYLAEAVWLPTALLPSGGVSWQAIDQSTARATLVDGDVQVSMVVEFGGRGEIVRISAQRHRDVNGHAELAPWIGEFGDYVRVEGMMVPVRGEVGWRLADGWTPYWRGRNVGWGFLFSGDPAAPDE